MKRILALILALSMLLAMAAMPGAMAEQKLVRIAWQGINEKDTMDPISGLIKKGFPDLVALIESKVPEARIEIVTIPNDGWIQKMETTLTSGEADIGWYTNQVLASQWFMDHREFMANDPEFTEETFEATFTEPAKQYTRYHTYDFPESAGAIIGLPYDQGCYWLMYDKLLFEQWGVEFPPVEELTYDKLLELAQKMTGPNPVTGEQNYGVYVKPYWCEWLGVGADLYHIIQDPAMDITKLDIAKDVDYIKDSPEVLKYFEQLAGFVKCAPAGAPAGTGNEKWLTEDNDIAIMLATDSTSQYMAHLMAENTDITDRFIPFMTINGEQGVSGFPEVHHVGVAKLATDKDLAWKVVKTICTDPDILNWLFENYAWGGVPALKDPSKINNMQKEFVGKRYEDRQTHTIITDDYWYWREPINKVFSSLFAGELTPEQARETFYNNVVEWVANKKAQLGK